MPMSFERRKTSKDRLKIKWDFPASIEMKVDKSGRTTAQVRMYALGVEEAFKRIRGDDERPLLIVRECGKCKGSDDAVLSRTLDNEKTLLLSRWFHCVKLMHHVLDELRADWSLGDVIEVGPPSPGYGGDPSDAKPVAEAAMAALSAVGD